MKRLRTIAAIALAAALCAPAWARDHFVLDGASIFTPAAVQKLDAEISSFNEQTGKEVVIVTVPALGGKTLRQATEDAFAHEQVNGVLIFMAKAEHQDAVVGDRAAHAFFPPGSFNSIHNAMRGYYRSGDFDTGIQTGVDLILNQYRGHERAAGDRVRRAGTIPVSSTQQSFGGLNMFWFIVILFAGFLIVRAVIRAMAGPRMMPPGYGGPGAPGPGFGGGGYGGPGYGGGGFGGGGGGGFLSGMLGGLGGAWLGNQLFGNHGGNMIDGNQSAGFDGGQGTVDNSGWQSDAGQADMSDGSFGSFDDSSGGGFSGGGDFGGGGDSGGGGW